MLNIPVIQQRLALLVSHELSTILKTQVKIEKIDIGFLNRIIATNLIIKDQKKDELIKVSRLSTKFEVIPLFSGRISINNIQLFGFNINLSKEDPNAKPNYQFIIDALSPKKEENKKDKPLDLRINSVVIRRGKLSYNVISEEETPGHFNPNHINIQNIVANISLKALQQDSLNASIKRLSIEEASGLDLKKLSLKVTANSKQMSVENFTLQMPNTSLNFDTIHLTYDSIASINDFANQVNFSVKTKPSYFTPQDLSFLVPQLSHFNSQIDLSLAVSGRLNQLECHEISLNADNDFQLKGAATFQELSNPENAFIYGKLSQLFINKQGVDFIFKNLGITNAEIPKPLKNLDDLLFVGEISGYFTDLVTYGTLSSNIGAIKTDLKISSSNDELKRFAYSGTVKSQELQLGKLLDNSNLGNVSFKLDINGKHIKKQKPDITFKGLISALSFNDYTYDDIYLDGRYNRNGFNGNIRLDDPNGAISVDGVINLENKTPVFDFSAFIHDFRPNALHLTKDYKEADFSVKLNANFEGNSIDNLSGTINIDSLQYRSPANNYFLNSLQINAFQKSKEVKHIDIISDFFNATIDGKFNTKKIPLSIKQILYKYLPTLINQPANNRAENNDFNLYVNINDTEFFTTLLNIPFHIYKPIIIKGNVNDNDEKIYLEGYLPRFKYEDRYFESGMFIIENNDSIFSSNIRLSQFKQNGAVNLSILTKAHNDSIYTDLHWGNNAHSTYSGKFSANTSFSRDESNRSKLKSTIDILETNVILSDSIWTIHPSKIIIEPKHIDVEDFKFTQGDRYLNISGVISDEPNDSIVAELKDINLGYVFDIADVTDDVFFGGDATGKAYASGVLNTPKLNTQLFIKGFSLNHELLGDLNIYGAWNNESKGIFLDAVINEEGYGKSMVQGYIYPVAPKGGLDLNINAHNLRVNFINHYMNTVVQDFTGRASGKVHFYGKFKELTLSGAVKTDASLKFDFLNTSFHVNDSIRLVPTGINFNHIKISDTEGNSGNLNGYVHYDHFKDINYSLDIHINNMLVMNTKEAPDLPFYGTVYATGNALLTGNARDGLNANVAVTTNRNTNFTYSTGATVSATNSQFITFVDKTPRRSIDSIAITTHYEEHVKQSQVDNSRADIRLNLLVDATPDATVKIIIDPVSGDYISAKGYGNIRTEFFNKGDVRLFGTYNIQQGVYKFSLQEVIRKDFIIKNGSRITFNGPPLNANLDINAYYTVTSASLNDLIPDASSFVQQPNIKVNCLMHLEGNLLNPTLKLDIELPTERDEIQGLVRNYISTEEQMNMQILYLLGLGKFYMENSTGTRQSDMMSSVLSSTLSGQLNNMLSQIIDNNNWNLGTNLSTGERGWTDVEVEGILSGQLLNNRLLINGNFGYRDNPMSNTNFIGDFEAEWLVNKNGDIRLKAYNETNDRYYTKTNLTTQGVGILFKKDFSKWNELFFWNRWKLRKMKHEMEKAKRKEEEEIEVIQ